MLVGWLRSLGFLGVLQLLYPFAISGNGKSFSIFLSYFWKHQYSKTEEFLGSMVVVARSRAPQ